MDLQYQVPQFIDVEDKIIGPLSLRQFFFLLGGGGVILVMFFTLKFVFVIIFGLPIAAIVIAFAFVKIDGIPFHRYVAGMLGYAFKPQKYLWRKKDQINIQDLQ